MFSISLFILKNFLREKYSIMKVGQILAIFIVALAESWLLNRAEARPAATKNEANRASSGLKNAERVRLATLNKFIGQIAKQMVSKMDLDKIFASDICPKTLTAELCAESKSNNAFYLWVKERRYKEIIKQLEQGLAEVYN